MPDPFSSPSSTNLHQSTTMNHPPSSPEDACIHDMDDFIKALTTLTSTNIQPEHITSLISHYATKWLPHFSQPKSIATTTSPTSSWIKKRFFIQTLIDFLPQENHTITCTFLLKLLKTANMLGIESTYVAQIEKRVALQLHQATIKELMIPSFDHTCVTLLDIDLVRRLVVLFVENNECSKCGFDLAKVAKLVDLYLAEAAMDAKLTITQFIDLAAALPHHARAAHDGLYRAIDTYLKAHPSVTKQERKTLCNIIDSQKLSQEAAIHAAQNERLPVRSVIQVLFSEQSKITHQLEWSGSFSGPRSSPMMPMSLLEPTSRCHSKRVTSSSTMMMMSPEQVEMRRLKEEVMKLQRRCDLFQEKMMEMMTLERKKSGFFKWWKFSLMSYFWSRNVVDEEKVMNVGLGGRKNGEVGTPMVLRGRTPSRWRKSALY